MWTRTLPWRDPVCANALQALIAIHTLPHEAERIARFLTIVCDQPETIEVLCISGGGDVLVRVAVSDVAHLQRFIATRVQIHPEVASVHTSLILNQRSPSSQMPIPNDDPSSAIHNQQSRHQCDITTD